MLSASGMGRRVRTSVAKGHMVSDDQEQDEYQMMASQKDIFACQDDDENVEMDTASEGHVVGEDLLTQARTQIEGKYIQRQSKRRAEDEEAVDEEVGDEQLQADGQVVFNPKPSEKSVYKVRQAYGALNNEISQHHAQLVESSGTGRIVEMVASANSFIREVQRTNEAVLDSRFLSSVAELSAEKVQKLPVSMSEFGLAEFISLTRNALVKLESAASADLSQSDSHAAEAWELLGKTASIFWKGATTCDFLCGPIAVVPKEKRERNAKVTTKKDKGPAKVVEAMTKEAFEEQVALTSASATPKNVIFVARTLAEYEEPVPFHAFISNPNSFAKSVENLFYCSFLVSEGRARIDIDQNDGEIYISLIQKDPSAAEHVRPKHQHVFNFSMSQWRAALRKFQITEPLIDFSEFVNL